MAIKSFPLFFCFGIDVVYIQCHCGGAWQDEKNPQKIVKTACNFQKTVYSMSSYREKFHPTTQAKEIRL